MYQLKTERGEKTLSDNSEIRKWINRGKITKSAALTHLGSGLTKSAGEWLDTGMTVGKRRRRSKSRERIEDPQKALTQILKDLEKRDPANYTREDIEELKSFYRTIKTYDIGGKVNWEDIARLRKYLSVLKKIHPRRMKAEKSAMAETGDLSSTLDAQELWMEEHPILSGKRRRPEPIPEPIEYRKPVGRRRQPAPTQPSSGDDRRPAVKNWFHSKFIIILALFFFPPVGLILLWTSPLKGGYSIMTRLILTFIFGSALITGWSEKGLALLNSIFP